MSYLNLIRTTLLPAMLPALLFSSCAVDSIRKVNAADEITETQAVIAAPTLPVETTKRKIKIALLLDTSSSMDGLIDQARAQLWKLVNELSLAKYGEEKPVLELALYEYGNHGLPAEEGYIRRASEFTGDLDLISEKLFALRTGGGEEYCGQVISYATQQLEWQRDSLNLQIIFIAGNESFHQGTVNALESCSSAKQNDIIVNTIFCGGHLEGITLGWRKGAVATQGNYMNIEKDQKTEYVETPYDNEIAQLNDQLNATYVHFGNTGLEKKANQLKQDQNASSYGKGNQTNRVLSKASKFYSNSTWDLVDASKSKEFDVTKIKEHELPDDLKNKTAEEKQRYIRQKTKEREEVLKQIEALNVKRNAYIAGHAKTNSGAQSLDAAMLKAIREQATRRNFTFES